MQSITPFLWFDNQAEQAAKFYVSIFKNSKIVEIRRYRKNVSAAVFRINSREFIAFNGGPHQKLSPAFSLFVEVKTQRELDDLWNKLLKGGKPIQCGWLTDKFGVSWQISPTILGEMLLGKDRAKADRVWHAMIQMVKIDIKKLKEAAGERAGKSNQPRR